MSKFKHIVRNSIYMFMRMLPVRKNNVLIFSYYGEQYSGSPKYIGKYLADNKELNIIWAFVDLNKHRNFFGRKVRYGHWRYYYHLATAGTIVTNYRMTEEFKKRNNQIYIQTWHSSLRLKMIENDAIDSLPMHYVEMAQKDSKQLDYLLAGSKKSREIFERAFWYEGTIVDSGTPQCDVLFEDRTPYIEKVFKHYNIPQGSHIALYAPTFRKDHNTDVYDLDMNELIITLERRFGGQWYLLMRLHPHLVGKMNCFNYSEKILPATDYDDVQELLCAADVLISDYSAIMFDYSVTRRPCFLYTPDIGNYTSKDRKLYFNINELPFKSFKIQQELFEEIEKFSLEEYQNELEEFLEEIGSFDDGQASKRVCDLIKGYAR